MAAAKLAENGADFGVPPLAAAEQRRENFGKIIGLARILRILLGIIENWEITLRSEQWKLASLSCGVELVNAAHKQYCLLSPWPLPKILTICPLWWV